MAMIAKPLQAEYQEQLEGKFTGVARLILLIQAPHIKNHFAQVKTYSLYLL